MIGIFHHSTCDLICQERISVAMLYKKLTPQNDAVFQAHNECMKECHEETGALGSNLAKKATTQIKRHAG